MGNSALSSWIITLLLLANVIGTGLVLQQVYDSKHTTDKSSAITPLASTKSSAKPLRDNSAIDNNTNKSPLAATVDGIDITQLDLLLYLNQLANPTQLSQWQSLEAVPKDILDNAIDNAALDKLLMQIAEKNNIPQNSRVQAVTKHQTDLIIKSALLNSIAPSLVDDNEVKKQYNELAVSLKGKIEYRASHILLANEKEANIIDKALNKEKKPFDELAKLFSLDNATSSNGGDLGFVLPGQLNQEFEKKVNTLEIGKVSSPFKTSLGWHIAVVNDRRESKAMPYQKAEGIIRRKLEQQAIRRYLDNVLASANIEVLIKSDPSDATADQPSPETNN